MYEKLHWHPEVGLSNFDLPGGTVAGSDWSMAQLIKSVRKRGLYIHGSIRPNTGSRSNYWLFIPSTTSAPKGFS